MSEKYYKREKKGVGLMPNLPFDTFMKSVQNQSISKLMDLGYARIQYTDKISPSLHLRSHISSILL